MHQSLQLFKELLEQKGIDINTLNLTKFKTKMKYIGIAFEDFLQDGINFGNLQYKPFNIYTLYENYSEISTLERYNIYNDIHLIKNQEIQMREKIEKNKTLENKEELLNMLKEIYNILYMFNNKNQYIKEYNKLKEIVDKYKKYNLISRLAEISSGIRIKLNGNVNNSYHISEYFTVFCLLLMIKGDTLHTGLFDLKNKYTKINKILNDNYKSIKSKRTLPQWLDKKIKKVSNGEFMPMLFYFSLYTNTFYFYDLITYKHTRDLFDNYYDNHCKYHFLMTHIANTTNGYYLERDIINKMDMALDDILPLIKHKKSIFCKTHIISKSGNLLYMTEYIKKNGRQVFVMGEDEYLGKYFISIDLFNFLKDNTIKIYTSVLDWEFSLFKEKIIMLLLDVIFTYIYFSLDNAPTNIKNKLQGIYKDKNPYILTKEHLKDKKYKNLNLLVTEISPFPPSLRRLPVGWKPSEEALQLAKEYNWEVPEGYTFVKEFEKKVHKKE